MANCVLLVEDNPSDEELTLRAFAKCGLANEIAVVRDGAEAIDYMFALGPYAGRDMSSPPTVVLLDLHLPKLDGFEVLRRIRSDERTKHQPVVILTASKQDEDRARGYALGVNAYVQKPVSFSQFADAVRTLGLFWLVMNEGPPRKRI
jgi:two-component system response regulator